MNVSNLASIGNLIGSGYELKKLGSIPAGKKTFFTSQQPDWLWEHLVRDVNLSSIFLHGMEATWINPHSHIIHFNIILPPGPKFRKWHPLELSNTISKFTFHIPSPAGDIIHLILACLMTQLKFGKRYKLQRSTKYNLPSTNQQLFTQLSQHYALRRPKQMLFPLGSVEVKAKKVTGQKRPDSYIYSTLTILRVYFQIARIK